MESEVIETPPKKSDQELNFKTKAKELGLTSKRFLDYETMSETALEKISTIKSKDRTYLSLAGWEKSRYAYYNWMKELHKSCP